MTNFRALMLSTVAAGFVAVTFGATPAAAGDRMVSSGSDKVKLKVSGQVNRMIIAADDGDATDIFFADNDASSTRIRWIGEAKGSEDLTVGAAIEMQIESNSTNSINAGGESAAIADTSGFGERRLEVYFASKSMGKLYLGQGWTAAEGATEQDLSGTGIAGYSDTARHAASYVWRASTETSTGTGNGGTTVRAGLDVQNVFNNFDGFSSRDDRIRYDSPSFGGAKVHLGLIQGGNTEVAVSYGGEIAGTKIKAAAGYVNVSTDDDAGPTTAAATNEAVYGGSISALYSSGLNLTVAYGGAERKGTTASGVTANTNDSDPDNIFIKLGYQGKFSSLGKTSIAIDWTESNDIAQNGDEATAIGLGIVQNLDAYGTELYAGVRNFELEDSTASTYDDITIGFVGARVKF